MKTAWQMAKGKLQIANGLGIFAICLLQFAICHAVDTPPRLIFSDAKLSFTVPDHWDVSPSFPFGPLMTRETQEGTQAFIVCQISDPINQSRFSVDVSTDALKDFATKDLSIRIGNGRILAANPRTLSGRNAYEVTWMNEGTEGTLQYQSVYFFMDNRFYVLSLRANRDSFPWIVQDFQNWLPTVNFLSRDEAGKLDAPAHGAMWIHQTGGAKIIIPPDWLVGVADDRQVGATIARDKMHLEMTASVDVYVSSATELSRDEKNVARQAIEKKGYTIKSESEEPFHGYPCYDIAYEGTVDDRFVRGEDLWISSPKARWLLSIEGDARLLRQQGDEWQKILNGIHFYE